jgi:hypothetical protein
MLRCIIKSINLEKSKQSIFGSDTFVQRVSEAQYFP